jgi:hypothetical protein
LFFARSNLRAKADTNARLHQVYYWDLERRVARKILARKFYFAGPLSQIDRAAATVTARQRFRPASVPLKQGARSERKNATEAQ